MLSVIIPTSESERALLRTLAPLVAGAAAGLVREVILADTGTHPGAARIADIAGCRLMTAQDAIGVRLAAAAATTRGEWLLFLRPGTVLEPAWLGETESFIERTGAAERAAVFRPGADALRPAFVEAMALLKFALGARPRPEQGLLIAKQFYERVGGHDADADDPEAKILRRLGRRRVVTLATAAVTAAD
jgi:hypothetical protein